jgi:hypothetical protein
MKEIKAYRCDYCGKLYMRYKPALNHEQNICLKNPNNFPLCYTCENYEPTYDTEEIVFGGGMVGTCVLDADYQEYSKEFSMNTCKALNKKLYFNKGLPQIIKDSLQEEIIFR